MKRLLSIICCTITLIGCANGQRPTNTPNSDIRTISGMHTLGGAGNVALMAARACDNEGKKLEIISSGTQNGITGTTYPVVVFKCVSLDNTAR